MTPLTDVHRPDWMVGQETVRDSQRFRWPVYVDRKSWPWIGLYEREEDARTAVARVNLYPEVVDINKKLRAEVERLRKPVEMHECEGYPPLKK